MSLSGDFAKTRTKVGANKGKSGKRDSNPRPSAWEADALPTELFPHGREISTLI